MNRLPQLLICDDDTTFHLAVKYALKGKFECRSAYHGDEALAIVRNHRIDLLLLDVQMRTPDEGLRYIPQLREADGDLAIVMSSGRTDFNTVREAMRLGATDYVPKDFDPNDLHHTLIQALGRRSLVQQQEQKDFEVRTQHQRKHSLVGESPAIKSLRKTIEKFRASNANVLITGETGTGKEVAARQMRGMLPDGSLAPFIAVDSATIQSSTAESLLFGHEKGAFTGAEKTTKGIFEEANGGIVYFDEIGNMPLEIQAKLLRVLQEKEVARLGSARAIQLEFRVVCATNKDLDQMVKQGHFKDDLLQRLNVLPLHLPPLRERKEDVPALLSHYLTQQPGKLKLSEAAVELLQTYPWPGNIRELINLVAYVATMADSEEIDLADLPPKIRDEARKSTSASAPASTGGNFYDQVAEFEKRILAEEYTKHGGNVSQLALKLGMDRSHLYTKLREYGIHASTKRS
jgi:DNA-binding NtrC family response regulator